MEWVVKLETRNGWEEVETIDVGKLERRAAGLTAEEVGLTLSERKTLLGELGRLILQTQIEEFITCARVCETARNFGAYAIDGPARSRLCLEPSASTRLVLAFARARAVRAWWMSPCRPWRNCFRTDARPNSGGFRRSWAPGIPIARRRGCWGCFCRVGR
jgi:hypothetical protein